MKLIDYKKAKKDFMYDAYSCIVEEPLPYQKITRSQMIKEIIKVYSNPQYIAHILSCKEVELLKEVIKNDCKIFDDTDNILSKKLLLLFDYENFDRYFHVPEEFQESVKEAIQTIDLKQLKKLDELNDLIEGLLMIYGTITINELVTILSHYKLSFDEEYLNFYIRSNPRVRFYSRMSYNVVCYLPYIQDESIEMIIELQKQLQTINYKIWSKKDVLSFVNKNYNQRDFKKLKKALEQEDNFFINRIFFDNFYETLNTVSDPEELFEWLATHPFSHSIDFYDLEDSFYNLFENYPSAGLKGHTINEIVSLKENDQNIEMNSEANLSHKDCDLFYKLYLGLIEFANNKLKVSSHKKYYQAEAIPPLAIHEIREVLYNNHLDIIDMFIKKNPYHFTQEELKIVKGFKNGIYDTFIVVEHRKDGTIVAGRGNETYLIKGLHTKMNEVCHAPSIAKMLILPFKNEIIYDSIISTMSISIGPNMRNDLLKDLSKQHPITTLSDPLIN